MGAKNASSRATDMKELQEARKLVLKLITLIVPNYYNHVFQSFLNKNSTVLSSDSAVGFCKYLCKIFLAEPHSQTIYFYATKEKTYMLNWNASKLT